MRLGKWNIHTYIEPQQYMYVYIIRTLIAHFVSFEAMLSLAYIAQQRCFLWSSVCVGLNAQEICVLISTAVRRPIWLNGFMNDCLTHLFEVVRAIAV